MGSASTAPDDLLTVLGVLTLAIMVNSAPASVACREAARVLAYAS
jgi:hypothetical protein